jgi:hypothetical protein
MSYGRAALALVILLALEAPLGTQAEAQEAQILPALIGGAAGLAAGGYVAIGIVTAQARRGRYLYDSEDALGWHATPILVGPSIGFLIGLLDENRLRRTVIGGGAGAVVGTGVGWLAGLHFWAPPEGKWAGAVIGGAAGLLAGSLAGALWPESDRDGGASGGAGSRTVPIRIVVPF